MGIVLKIENNCSATEVLLKHAGDKAEGAIAEALNRGVASMRPELSKAIRAIYNIKATDLNREMSSVVTTNKAMNGDESASLKVGLKYFPLMNFQPRGGKQKGVKVKRRRKVTVAVKRSSSRTTLDNAFIARMSSGKFHILERKEPDDFRSTIKALYGPTILGMSINDGVSDRVLERGEEMFENRLQSNLNYLLFGKRKL